MHDKLATGACYAENQRDKRDRGKGKDLRTSGQRISWVQPRFVYAECGAAGRVPLRSIHLSGGEKDVLVYDTSGPYGDPDYQIDIVSGLPKRRGPGSEDSVFSRRAPSGFYAETLRTGQSPAVTAIAEGPEDGSATQLSLARKGVMSLWAVIQ